MDKILFFKNKDEFYNYLLKHNQNHQEIWIGFYKKHTGKNTLTWPESVDVAISFGWIDSIRKTIDQDSYKIRFSPRKENSLWSKINIEKAKKIIKEKKMTKKGLSLFNDRKDKEGYSSKTREVELRKDLKLKFKKNKKAWSFFDKLASSYKRDSIWWVMSAKKEETKLRRLDILIQSSENELKIPLLRKK